jgi:hypothetical protein
MVYGILTGLTENLRAEVIAPDKVAVGRPQPDARPVIEPSRLLLGCFLVIFSPSSRQIRSTRLWFTRHPSQCNRAIILRYP